MAPKSGNGSAPEDEDFILDLRELVTRQRVMLSTGTYELRRITSLSPLERAEVVETQRNAQGLMESDAADEHAAAELLRAAGDLEDRILSFALPDTTREQRDEIPGAERAGVMAAFFGAPDEQARTAAMTMARMVAAPVARTGAKRSPGSSASTGARRRSS